MINEGLAREIINRVQRLRKKAGLNPTDIVGYYYSLNKDPEDALKNAFASQQEFLAKNLKQDILKDIVDGPFIAEEEQEINDSTFNSCFEERRIL